MLFIKIKSHKIQNLKHICTAIAWDLRRQFIDSLLSFFLSVFIGASEKQQQQQHRQKNEKSWKRKRVRTTIYHCDCLFSDRLHRTELISIFAFLHVIFFHRFMLLFQLFLCSVSLLFFILLLLLLLFVWFKLESICDSMKSCMRLPFRCHLLHFKRWRLIVIQLCMGDKYTVDSNFRFFFACLSIKLKNCSVLFYIHILQSDS